MDTAQWPQEILMKPMEEINPNTCSSSVTTAPNIISNSNNTNNNINNNSNNNNNNCSNSKSSSSSIERKVRPQKDQAVNCPRCNSTNTKFCYYNNYSLTQPRYFCKTCRRYWTEGGSLRNIPVGGGSRKNKRSLSSSSSSTSLPSTALAIKKLSSHDFVPNTAQFHHHLAQNPKIHHQGQDLNLGFNPNHHQEFRSLSEFMQLPTIETTQKGQIPKSGASTTTNGANHHHHLSALELLNGFTPTRGLTPFMPMPVSGFPPLQDYKPSLSFSLVDGLGNGNGFGGLHGEVNHHHHHQASNEANNGRLLFPFEDLKQVSSTTSADHNNNSADNHNNNNNSNNHEQNGEQGDSTPGYWSGMLGSGVSW